MILKIIKKNMTNRILLNEAKRYCSLYLNTRVTKSKMNYHRTLPLSFWTMYHQFSSYEIWYYSGLCVCTLMLQHLSLLLQNKDEHGIGNKKRSNTLLWLCLYVWGLLLRFNSIFFKAASLWLSACLLSMAFSKNDHW